MALKFSEDFICASNLTYLEKQIDTLKQIIPEKIPAELKDQPYWLLWRPQPNKKTRDNIKTVVYSDDNKPKILKLPIGKDWPNQRNKFEDLELRDPQGYGFNFAKDHPYICIDIDSASAANEKLLNLFESYTEWSPSGEGAHIWIKTNEKAKVQEVLGRGKRNKSDERDLFISSGYVTITGRPIQICPYKEIKSFSADDIINKLSPYFLHDLKSITTPVTKEKAETSKKLHNLAYGLPTKINPQQIQGLLELIPVKNLTADIFERLNTPGKSARLDLLNEEEAREPWLIIGQALHNGFKGDQTGFMLWDSWSRLGNKYDSDAIYATWKSLGSAGIKNPITIATLFALAKAQKLEFPHLSPKGIPLCTFENFKAYLDYFEYDVRFNTVTNSAEVTPPEKKMKSWGLTAKNFNSLSSVSEFIHGDLALQGVPVTVFAPAKIKKFLQVIAHQQENMVHPIRDYFTELDGKWDGKSRLNELMATIILPDDTSDLYKQVYRLFIRKWLIQTVAAAHASYKNTYMLNLVLILQGIQGVGKTKWVKSLFPTGLQMFCAADKDIKISMFRSDQVKLTMELTSTLICNINEIDRVFKPDTFPDFKAFLDKTSEQVVLPYGDAPIIKSRQTTFIGSTNKTHFLQDESGNRRFFIIDLKRLDFNHSINLDQLWAEIYSYYKSGENWWTDNKKAIQVQNYINNKHMYVGNEELVELLEDLYDASRPIEEWQNVVFKDIRVACGIVNMPVNGKAFREAKRALYLWLKTLPHFKEPWTSEKARARKFYFIPPLRKPEV